MIDTLQIAVCRKPAEGEVSGLNIKGCMVGQDIIISCPARSCGKVMKTGMVYDSKPFNYSGRWPSNVIIDNSKSVLDIFLNCGTMAFIREQYRENPDLDSCWHSVSRYFYSFGD